MTSASSPALNAGLLASWEAGNRVCRSVAASEQGNNRNYGIAQVPRPASAGGFREPSGSRATVQWPGQEITDHPRFSSLPLKLHKKAVIADRLPGLPTRHKELTIRPRRHESREALTDAGACLAGDLPK
jgi:hypothetical protein